MPSASCVLRVGVLGAANVAPSALIRPAAGVREVEVAAVASRDPRRARAFAKKHAVHRVFDEYEQLLSDPEIDAVYIALPVALHARWMLEAINAGKHVLCEKPFTSNASAAQRV